MVSMSSSPPIRCPNSAARSHPSRRSCNTTRGAISRFTGYYTDMITKWTATTKPGTVCEISPLILTQLYIGKTIDAKANFDRLYRGDSATSAWNILVTAAQHGRFYVVQ